jgi:hypothetical protein
LAEALFYKSDALLRFAVFGQIRDSFQVDLISDCSGQQIVIPLSGGKSDKQTKTNSVALIRTDVSEEPGASFIRVTKIGELGTTQAATSNRRAAYVGC